MLVLVSACGRIAESRLNPFNWFGQGRQEAVVTAPADISDIVAQDGRPLIEQVVGMSVDRMAGGAIVRATGLPPTQGWWGAALLPENGGVPVDGVLSFAFVNAPPPAPRRASTQQSRELTVATFVSDQNLAGVRQITIRGAANQASSRR